MEHCCQNMNYYSSNMNKLLQYSPYVRAYRFFIYDSLNGTQQILWYCPWCGKKLPKELDEAWGKTLEKEHGITDPFDEDKDKVPKEFWTDEWWKKRGL